MAGSALVTSSPPSHVCPEWRNGQRGVDAIFRVDGSGTEADLLGPGSPRRWKPTCRASSDFVVQGDVVGDLLDALFGGVDGFAAAHLALESAFVSGVRVCGVNIEPTCSIRLVPHLVHDIPPFVNGGTAQLGPLRLDAWDTYWMKLPNLFSAVDFCVPGQRRARGSR